MKALGILSVVSVMIAFSTGVEAKTCTVTIITEKCPEACREAAKKMCEEMELDKCMAEIRAHRVDACADCAPEEIDIKCE